MATNYDVIVVGAGPAGSRVARDIARAGYSVGLLEQHRQVGLPCHCSGLVSPRTLNIAAVGDDMIINTIAGATIHLPGDLAVDFVGDRPKAYVIDRPELDRRLAQQAVASGAELLLQAHYQSFERTTDKYGVAIVIAKVVRNGERSELTARLLIGADGAHSRVGRQMRGYGTRNCVHSLGAEVQYVALETSSVELFVDPHAAPGWFGWAIPLGATSARIGTGTTNGITPAESFKRLQVAFPGALAGAEVLGQSGGHIPLWRPTAIVDDNLMLVGDAARQVKPVSGGGIYSSLVAAGLAAKTAIAGLNKARLTGRDLASYPEAWNRVFGSELRRQVDMRRIADSFTLDDWQGLARGVSEGGRPRAVARSGDIDYPSRVATALAWRAPMVPTLAKSIIRHPMAWAGILAGTLGGSRGEP